MENLGQYLKALREERNISPEEVNKEIKLSLEQVNAIENNQLSRLGDYGFSRAMVYTYIRFLGADEKIAMNLFDMLMPSRNQSRFVPKTPIREKKVLISVNFIWLIAIILIVIVLGSIIWISYTKGYLTRPFDRKAVSIDSLRTEIPVKARTEKLDTVRAHLLKIANTSNNKPSSSKEGGKGNSVNKNISASDTTDYVNEMIFEGRESPFNQGL